MADKAITDLNTIPGSVDDNNTWFAVAQSGTAYKVSGHEFVLALGTILDGHGGVKTIVYTPPVAPSLTGTMVVTLADNTTTTVNVENGKGIVSISKTSTSGLNDTYTILYNDNSTSTFVVSNGAKGDTGDAWYVWIRYSGRNPISDSDIGTTPDDWMGVYSGTSATAPTHYTDYAWFQIKGEKGDTGDSIDSIVKTGGTGAPGTIDTYTAYADGTAVGSFTVYNGADGQGSPGSQLPVMDGVAAAGSANAYSREDHVHPTDTSRASQIEMNTANSAITNLNAALEAQENLYFYDQTLTQQDSGGVILRIPSTGTSADITTDSVPIGFEIDRPYFVKSKVTWQSFAGYVEFSGTCNNVNIKANVTIAKKKIT